MAERTATAVVAALQIRRRQVRAPVVRVRVLTGERTPVRAEACRVQERAPLPARLAEARVEVAELAAAAAVPMVARARMGARRVAAVRAARVQAARVQAELLARAELQLAAHRKAERVAH